MTERERRIRERAKRLWQEAGQPEGQDERFWLQAEQEVDAEDRSAGAVRREDPAGPPVGSGRR
jgi:hypothetical protein